MKRLERAGTSQSRIRRLFRDLLRHRSRDTDPDPAPGASKTTLKLTGTVPPETWNRLGTRVIPKLHDVDRLVVGIDFTIDLATPTAAQKEAELKQILSDLGLSGRVYVERS